MSKPTLFFPNLIIYAAFHKTFYIVFTVPNSVASIELVSRTKSSLIIAWAEPQNTDFVRYDIEITPNDGGESPFSVNK